VLKHARIRLESAPDEQFPGELTDKSLKLQAQEANVRVGSGTPGPFSDIVDVQRGRGDFFIHALFEECEIRRGLLPLLRRSAE